MKNIITHQSEYRLYHITRIGINHGKTKVNEELNITHQSEYRLYHITRIGINHGKTKVNEELNITHQ